MTLMLTSRASPFGRKVKIALSLCGLASTIVVQEADTNNADDPLRRHNPLGKIPVLILEDGTAIYDSSVIVEWIDKSAGGNRIIPAGDARIAVLIQQALADGILDAALALVYEKRYRPEALWHQPWMDRQTEKVKNGLATFESALPALSETPDIGAITLACVLGYQDLRFDPKWRDDYPGLAGWLSEFSELVPAYKATDPGAT